MSKLSLIIASVLFLVSFILPAHAEMPWGGHHFKLDCSDISALKKSASINKAKSNVSKLFYNLRKLGECSREQGNYEEAISYFKQALDSKFLKEQSDPYLTLQKNEIYLLNTIGKFLWDDNEAKEFFTEAELLATRTARLYPEDLWLKLAVLDAMDGFIRRSDQTQESIAKLRKKIAYQQTLSDKALFIEHWKLRLFDDNMQLARFFSSDGNSAEENDAYRDALKAAQEAARARPHQVTTQMLISRLLEDRLAENTDLPFRFRLEGLKLAKEISARIASGHLNDNLIQQSLWSVQSDLESLSESMKAAPKKARGFSLSYSGRKSGSADVPNAYEETSNLAVVDEEALEWGDSWPLKQIPIFDLNSGDISARRDGCDFFSLESYERVRRLAHKDGDWLVELAANVRLADCTSKPNYLKKPSAYYKNATILYSRIVNFSKWNQEYIENNLFLLQLLSKGMNHNAPFSDSTTILVAQLAEEIFADTSIFFSTKADAYKRRMYYQFSLGSAKASTIYANLIPQLRMQSKLDLNDIRWRLEIALSHFSAADSADEDLSQNSAYAAALSEMRKARFWYYKDLRIQALLAKLISVSFIGNNEGSPREAFMEEIERIYSHLKIKDRYNPQWALAWLNTQRINPEYNHYTRKSFVENLTTLRIIREENKKYYRSHALFQEIRSLEVYLDNLQYRASMNYRKTDKTFIRYREKDWQDFISK